ncbi:MAG: FAD-dependent oxidoreductase [Cyclobacteriaceae bacterium]|nr:FAD-dependent oxidoreductase [Cyclobacteriaceae bacterium]
MKKLFSLALLLIIFSCRTEEDTPAPEYDIVIYGGTSSGVIAAYAAKMLGKSVLLIHPGDRLGGLSSGGLGQTDIGNKYAVTGLAREFYRKLGDHYGQFESWKFEPKEALRIFREYIDEAGIPVLYNRRLMGVNKENNHILSVKTDYMDPEHESDPEEIKGKTFIDCSYEGDLMAMAGVSYTIGRESNEKYGETLNGVQFREFHQFPDGVDPYVIPDDPESGLLWGISPDQLEPDGTGDNKIQTYNFRICLTNDPDNLIPITRPDSYDPARYELLIRLFEAQPGKRKLNDYFSWDLMPNHKTDINNNGGFSTDMIGMNYDYPEADWNKRKQIIADHTAYTKGLLYFCGNDPRVPLEIREEISHWGYPADEYTDHANWSPQPYIREARRMTGAYVMTEHHCRGEKVVDDPVALAAYTMDSHNCQRIVVDGMVKNEGDVQVGGFPPYPISYRSLVPVENECENLIVPVCLSASHIAYGSIRMEPVFMVLGQVSAIAASLSLDQEISVQHINHEEVVEILNSDPLLNGTLPEITVDNEDAGVDYQGEWKTENHFMRNYKNSLMVLNQPEPSDYYEFLINSDAGAEYDIYFYCPLYNGDPGTIRLVVNHAEGENIIDVDYLENSGDWAFLGKYTLEKNREYAIRLIPVKDTGLLIADAVLLVPMRD